MQRGEIRVGIVGIGNCASSLVQGVHFYSQAEHQAETIGLMHEDFGGYLISDIKFVSAFDVETSKVGADLSEAIFASPNNTIKFSQPEQSGVIVSRGLTLDGIGKYLDDVIEESALPPCNVVQQLKDTQTQVLVSYLPVGSQAASEYYANAALEAGCAYINCIPVFLASNPIWAKKFEDAGLPIIGDDIKSQLGATILHRTLVKLMSDRGISIDRTYQLNFGGNTDFLNMLERERLESKKISKTQSVTSQYKSGRPNDVHIGPSDYVPWLEDRKWAHIRIEGRGFGNTPMSIELKLEVWDSPNSAGVIVDAIRGAKVALDNHQTGAICEVSGYLMKSPPNQNSDSEAHVNIKTFSSMKL